MTSKLNYFLPRETKGQEKILCVRLPRIPDQGCQFGFFEAKFVIFGLFSTPLAFFFWKKAKWNLAFLATKIYYVDLAD